MNYSDTTFVWELDGVMRKIIIAATTINGKIAKISAQNVNWTSRKDKIFFRTQTQKAQVVIFGANTYNIIGRALPDRLNVIMTRNPGKYRDEQKKDLLEFTSEEPENILADLEKRGYEGVIIGGGSSIYSLFLARNLVDEIYITFVPKIFGQGLDLFKTMNIEDIRLELIEFNALDDEGEILVKYKVN